MFWRKKKPPVESITKLLEAQKNKQQESVENLEQALAKLREQVSETTLSVVIKTRETK